MRKIILGLLVLVPLLKSCSEDEDKNIQTDLSTEAAQLFEISTVWNESVFYALIPFQEYLSNDSLQLPGKPIIEVDTTLAEVRLVFHPDSVAKQSGKYKRSGVLNLKFKNGAAENSTVTLTYENYSFEGDSLKGSREFRKPDSSTYLESFSELHHVSEKKMNTIFEGEFSHSKRFLADSLVSFTSTGQLSGKNSVGRDFSIIITKAQESIVDCYNQNLIFPATGTQTWTVSRGGVNSVNYKMNYEVKDTCKTEVYVTLPDGKRLLLNPA